MNIYIYIYIYTYVFINMYLHIVQMKLENVERVMRQGEYKKSITLKKIEDQDG
jgi:hypothetical protein